MKKRLDLTPKSPEVLSSPYSFYVDPQGLVNEIEDWDEPVLFGTVELPLPEPRLMDRKKRKAKRVMRTINKRRG